MNKINNLIKLLNKLGHSDKAEEILKVSEELGESIRDDAEQNLGESLTTDSIISMFKEIDFPIKGTHKGLSWETKKIPGGFYAFFFNWDGSNVDEGNLKPIFYRSMAASQLKTFMSTSRGEGRPSLGRTTIIDMIYSDEIDYSAIKDSTREYKTKPEHPSWSDDVANDRISNEVLESKVRLLEDAVIKSFNEYVNKIIDTYNYVEKDLDLAIRQTSFTMSRDEIPYNLSEAHFFGKGKFKDLQSIGEINKSNFTDVLSNFTLIWGATNELKNIDSHALQMAFEHSIIL